MHGANGAGEAVGGVAAGAISPRRGLEDAVVLAAFVRAFGGRLGAEKPPHARCARLCRRVYTSVGGGQLADEVESKV